VAAIYSLSIINFMNINFFISNFFLIIILLIVLCSIFYYTSNIQINENNLQNFYLSSDDFFWPLPGINRITSYFGPRKAPTSGASSIHSGIDIAAPENTAIYSVLPCQVISTSFKGAGGCTIVTKSNEFTISYCHVSPNFIVRER